MPNNGTGNPAAGGLTLTDLQGAMAGLTTTSPPSAATSTGVGVGSAAPGLDKPPGALAAARVFTEVDESTQHSNPYLYPLTAAEVLEEAAAVAAGEPQNMDSMAEQ